MRSKRRCGSAGVCWKMAAILCDLAPGDDYAMMREVLTRRYKRLAGVMAASENGSDGDALADGLPDRPDLILIDGGKGQLAIAQDVLSELELEDIPVIGVAKTGFQGADVVAEAVLRGKSERPLWVTAEGIEVDRAARWIRQMHGPHRIPTLLKRVDRLCRGEDG